MNIPRDSVLASVQNRDQNEGVRARRIAFFLLVFLLFGSPLWAATYYVSPNGNDEAKGTQEAPWRTLGYASAHISGGDTLLIKDGLYRGTENQIWNLPNGRPDRYTTISAEHPFQVTLQRTGADIYEREFRRTPIRLMNNTFIRISGLKIRDSPTGGAISIIASHHIKILRISIINGTRYDDRWGSPLTISFGSHHVLCEDVWIAGAMRYGALVAGSHRNDPDQKLATTSHIILRRVVVRWDYMRTIEPKAGIAFYGAESDEQSGGVVDSICQNCLVLDMNPADEYYNHYGAYYNPKNTQNIEYYGSMALNIQGKTTGSVVGGFFVADNLPRNRGQRVINSVAWDIAGPAVRFSEGDPKGFGEVRQSTLGNSMYGVYLGGEPGESRLPVTIENTLFIGNKAIHSSARELLLGASSHNIYFPISRSFLLKNALFSSIHKAGALTTDPQLKYLTRIEPNSPAYQSGENGVSRGATLLYRYGAPETVWGEPGWDSLTSTPLWPWPYEDQIKADFAMPNDPPKGAYPPVNNTQRGFVQKSLTRYIWEYLGAPCPTEICRSETTPSDTKPTIPPLTQEKKK